MRTLRLEGEDLLAVLRPRVLLPAVALSVLFALLSMYAHAGKWLLLGVVGVGSIVALVSPTWGYVLCVFLFAFRNNEFSPSESVKLADPLFAITAASWCVHVWLRGKLRWHWTLVPIGLYTATSLLSGLQAEYPAVFLKDAIRLFYLVAIPLLGVQLLGEDRTFVLAVKAFLAAGLVMSICAVLGLVDRTLLHGDGMPFTDNGSFRILSIAVDPLRIPSFLIFPLLLTAGLQSLGRNPWERHSANALVWLGIVACLLSMSRSAVLQLIPGLLVLWWLTRTNFRKLALLGGISLLVVAIFSAVSLNPKLVRRYQLYRYAVAGHLDENAQEPRMVIWGASLRAFQSSPWIGVGLDNFKSRYFEFRDPWLARGWIYYNTKGSHSAYLAQMAETGILGTAAFLVMLVSFLVLARRLLVRARQEGNRAQYLFLAAALGGYVGQLVAGTALELFAHNHVWVLMTLLMVLDRRPAATTAAVSAPVPAPVAEAT